VKQVFSCEGQIRLLERDIPVVDKSSLLIRTAYSFISSGTEKSSVQHGKRSTISKIVSNPHKLGQAFLVLKASGFKALMNKATSHSKPKELGYSCVGVVEQVGDSIDSFKKGDIVACAGAGRANHAEVISVPVNLAVKVPTGCPIKYAATVAAGAIALQGVRRSKVRMGENVAVIGLGLMGQITIQCLQIAGTHVIGFDLDRRRVRIAEGAGIKASTLAYPEQVAEVMRFTDGWGADSTILAASSKSDAIVQSAMEMTRKKGVVVVVGDVGLRLQRSPFYEKELDLVISCSYGPGRYDSSYEDEGIDYPYDYVRWTAHRNMQEYLRQMAAQRLRPNLFAEKIIPFERASEAYHLLEASIDRPVGILLDYHLNLDEIT
jgi:threonine dehydrogenase-like Zn-dependent dehydrogenase